MCSFPRQQIVIVIVIVRMMSRIAKTHPCVPFQDGTWSTSMLGCEEDDAEEGGASVEFKFDFKKSL